MCFWCCNMCGELSIDFFYQVFLIVAVLRSSQCSDVTEGPLHHFLESPWHLFFSFLFFKQPRTHPMLWRTMHTHSKRTILSFSFIGKQRMMIKQLVSLENDTWIIMMKMVKFEDFTILPFSFTLTLSVSPSVPSYFTCWELGPYLVMALQTQKPTIFASVDAFETYHPISKIKLQKHTSFVLELLT
jgi:hypothetical protein